MRVTTVALRRLCERVTMHREVVHLTFPSAKIVVVVETTQRCTLCSFAPIEWGIFRHFNFCFLIVEIAVE